MTRSRRADGRAGRRVDWKPAVGILISAIVLYFTLRGVDAREVVREIAQANPWYFAASAFAATFVLVIRAWRWKPLLEPVRRDTEFRPRFAATMIGFMANNVLPVRVGEFARAYALARMQPVTISASFGSIVVERLFDGLTIIALIAAVILLGGLPTSPVIGGRDLSSAIALLGAAFGFATLLLLVLVLWPRQSVAIAESTVLRILPPRFRRPVIDVLESFLGGLGVLRSPALVLRVSLWSLALWLFNAVSFWLAFRAFGVEVGFAGAVFLQAIIALAVAVPAAPGFFGVWEGAARLVLVEIWAVEVNKAVGFAIGFHIAGFLPVTLIGMYYAWRLGISLGEVKESGSMVERAVESGDSTEQPRSGKGSA